MHKYFCANLPVYLAGYSSQVLRFILQWERSSSAKRPAKRSAKKTYLAELLSTDLSRRWDKTSVLASSLYPQVTELWAVQAEE